MQLLLEAEVRQLTLGALQQFNLDVRECERKTGNHPFACLFHLYVYSLLWKKKKKKVCGVFVPDGVEYLDGRDNLKGT